jgi:nitrite reductase/ring-hydroxylating ferredoxin subunit
LRFLHPWLHRRLVRLNEVQNREDDPVRDRRVTLRALGYRFKTDDPDFVNSNLIENNTIFPPVGAPESIVLGDLPDQRAIEISVANRALILRRDGQAVDVWPGVCPHEGSELKAENLCDNTVKCPLHGLEFASRRLGEGQNGITVCGARLDLANGRIDVSRVKSDALA